MDSLPQVSQNETISSPEQNLVSGKHFESPLYAIPTPKRRSRSRLFHFKTC